MHTGDMQHHQRGVKRGYAWSQDNPALPFTLDPEHRTTKMPLWSGMLDNVAKNNLVQAF